MAERRCAARRPAGLSAVSAAVRVVLLASLVVTEGFFSLEGQQIWTGWGILAYNLATLVVWDG